MFFQKILVPLDGSEHSGRALEAAVQIAKQFNSKIMLFTVYHVSVAPIASPELTMPMIGPVPGATSAGLSSMTAECARDFGKKILSEAEAKVRSEKIDVQTEIAEGNAVDEIVNSSKKGDFDLIVMGARGLSTIKKLFIGSVSEGVIKKAHCPVLVVK